MTKKHTYAICIHVYRVMHDERTFMCGWWHKFVYICMHVYTHTNADAWVTWLCHGHEDDTQMWLIGRQVLHNSHDSTHVYDMHDMHAHVHCGRCSRSWPQCHNHLGLVALVLTDGESIHNRFKPQLCPENQTTKKFWERLKTLRATKKLESATKKMIATQKLESAAKKKW